MQATSKIKNIFIRICIAIFLIGGTYIVIGWSYTEHAQQDLVFTTQSNEPFSCTGVSTIPFDECKALSDIYSTTQGIDRDIQTNRLIGNDPCRWHGVTWTDGHVTYLNLSNNSLQGNIPASLGFLTQLEQLYLGKNNLSGPIPASFEEFTNLKQLQLQRNSLTGGIPQELGRLGQNAQQVHIFLENNRLCGTIPKTMFENESIKTFTVENNNLIVDLDSYDNQGIQRIESTLSTNDKNQIAPQEC